MENDNMAYLAKCDSVMGRRDGIELLDGELVVEDAGFSEPLYGKMNPSELPWDELDVDVAYECTVSIAGGAYIRALTGAQLVGIEMLKQAA